MSMNTLESLGRGYSTLGAVVSALFGVALVGVGVNIRNNDPQNADKGTQLIIAGVAVGAVGIGVWYMAKVNKDIAAVEGLWLVVLVAGGIIGAFKAHDNVQMSLK